MGRGQGNLGTSNSSTSQGEVQATVGAMQARMIFALRAMHGSTINSSKIAGDGTPNERMRLAPLRNALMLDSGAQVSAVHPEVWPCGIELETWLGCGSGRC